MYVEFNNLWINSYRTSSSKISSYGFPKISILIFPGKKYRNFNKSFHINISTSAVFRCSEDRLSIPWIILNSQQFWTLSIYRLLLPCPRNTYESFRRQRRRYLANINQVGVAVGGWHNTGVEKLNFDGAVLKDWTHKSSLKVFFIWLS